MQCDAIEDSCAWDKLEPLRSAADFAELAAARAEALRTGAADGAAAAGAEGSAGEGGAAEGVEDAELLAGGLLEEGGAAEEEDDDDEVRPTACLTPRAL